MSNDCASGATGAFAEVNHRNKARRRLIFLNKILTLNHLTYCNLWNYLPIHGFQSPGDAGHWTVEKYPGGQRQVSVQGASPSDF
jgi:hypothetical protein